MAGRPPSEKSFANMLRIAIKQAHNEEGDKLRAVAEALVAKAISGDVAAIREVADRIDGKVPQSLEHAGADGEPLSVVIKQFVLANAADQPPQ